MNEKVENLILEHLRAMRNDIGKVRDDISTLKAEMVSLRQHVGSIATLQHHDHGDIGAIKDRFDRIERRLELNDQG
jgi:predicted  nucleic acid-binding Zn-ribbon protein